MNGKALLLTLKDNMLSAQGSGECYIRQKQAEAVLAKPQPRKSLGERKHSVTKGAGYFQMFHWEILSLRTQEPLNHWCRARLNQEPK